jgi:hypothetical protein
MLGSGGVGLGNEVVGDVAEEAAGVGIGLSGSGSSEKAVVVFLRGETFHEQLDFHI